MASNAQQLAEEYALHTDKSIFLTGRAGTGKTTLLGSIVARTKKPYVIAAPTGVAAINAGGVTLHSMFSLPLLAHIPSNDFVDVNIARNRRTLLSHARFRREKLNVLRNMELLIIDEVSMVRCDILDAVDWVLRSVRRKRLPFGGVQVMLIGDMYQLPPVVRNHEWELLREYYDGPYFFNSKVWAELDALHIELTKVYRQKDERFLKLLNNIRNYQPEEDDFRLLKERYNPRFYPKDEGYVLLTTHNQKADSVNLRELNALPGQMHRFNADIEGEFPEHLYPCEPQLQLKAGAQVMFIRNDVEDGRYYNGKLATVVSISADGIRVRFQDKDEEYLVGLDTWENISYSASEGSPQISKKTLGKFSQYPIRLAWAVTIHKSQGLTFDKVIIDAGESFAPGQVYVALSRCRTLEGIVLHSLISPGAIIGNRSIEEFAQFRQDVHLLENSLNEARYNYSIRKLRELFDFMPINGFIDEWLALVKEKQFENKNEHEELIKRMQAQHAILLDTAEKFQKQLDRLLLEAGNTDIPLSIYERSSKAIDYFVNFIFQHFITPAHQHFVQMGVKKGLKGYVQEVKIFENYLWRNVDELYSATFMDKPLFDGNRAIHRGMLKEDKSVQMASGKQPKGATYEVTLQMFREGLSLLEIAEKRSMAYTTIEGHFARLMGEQKLKPEEVLEKEKIELIQKALDSVGVNNLTDVKSRLDDSISFGEIRMVMSANLAEKGAQALT